MESDKKEKNGNYFFLVILSSLGMLFIILWLAFEFFYPGDKTTFFSKVPELLSSSATEEEQQPEPEVNPNVESSDIVEAGPELDRDDKNEEAPGPGVSLDDSDALINSLMSEENTSFNTDGPLTIQFDDKKNTQGSESQNVVLRQDPPKVVVTEPEPVVTPNPVPAAPQYRTVTRDVYWIQVASFPNSVKAEELQLNLSKLGIDTTVQTKNINGSLYYRVRIGAFGSKDEAENFSNQLLALPEVEETTIYTSSISQRVKVE